MRGCLDGQTDGQLDGRIEEMDGQMDGWLVDGADGLPTGLMYLWRLEQRMHAWRQGWMH